MLREGVAEDCALLDGKDLGVVVRVVVGGSAERVEVLAALLLVKVGVERVRQVGLERVAEPDARGGLGWSF